MSVYLQDPDVTLHHGDVLDTLRAMPDESVDCVVTSPPYLDARPEYPSPSMEQFAEIFEALRRVVEGACLVNVGRLWRGGVEQMWWVDLIRAATQGGWALLDTLIWIKPNANPIHGAVLASSHEYVLIFGRPGASLNVDGIRTKYAPEAVARMARTWRNGRGVKGEVREDQQGRPLHPKGARPRSYVIIHVGREKGNEHPAPMALDLAEHLVNLASWPGQSVLDPFVGSGTTCLAARKLDRRSVGIDLSEEYLAMAARRLQQQSLFAVGT